MKGLPRLCAAAVALAGLVLGLSGCELKRTHIYLYQPCDMCGN